MEQERELRHLLRVLTATEQAEVRLVWDAFAIAWRGENRRSLVTLRDAVHDVLVRLEQVYFLTYANSRDVYERAVEHQAKRGSRPTRRDGERVERRRQAYQTAEEEHTVVADFLLAFDETYSHHRLRQLLRGGGGDDEQQGRKRRKETDAPPIEPVDAELCLYPAAPNRAGEMVRFIGTHDQRSIAFTERLSSIPGFMPVLAREPMSHFPRTRYALCKDVTIDEPVICYDTVALYPLFVGGEALSGHERFGVIFELLVSLSQGFRYNDAEGWPRHLKCQRVKEPRRYAINGSEEIDSVTCTSEKRVVICDYREATQDTNDETSIYLKDLDLLMFTRILRSYPVANVTVRVLILIATATQLKQPVRFSDLFRALGEAYRHREFTFV